MNIKVKHIILLNGMEIITKVDADSNWKSTGRLELIDACFLTINVLSEIMPESMQIPKLHISKMNPWIKRGQNPFINIDHIVTIVDVDEVVEAYYESALAHLNQKHEEARTKLEKGKLIKRQEPQTYEEFKENMDELMEDDLGDKDELTEEESNELFKELLTKKKYIN